MHESASAPKQTQAARERGADVEEYEATVARTAGVLARLEIDAAAASPGVNRRRLDRAETLHAAGLAAEAAGDYVRAAQLFKRSWQQARAATPRPR